jgi:glycosyltransferase involved in cell wall biosynthesis
MTTVALDLSPLAGGSGGVRRYVEQLWAHLPSAGVQPIPIHNSVPGTNSLRLRPTLAWLQFAAPCQVLYSGAQFAHFGSGRASLLCPCPTVLTVHDLSALLWPAYYPWRERLLVRPWLDRSIRRAAAIIAVSDDTAAALHRRYPRLQAQVQCIHPAVAACFLESASRQALDAEARQLGSTGPIWLHVTGPTLRKNSRRVLRAYALARSKAPAATGDSPLRNSPDRRPPQLVVAGRLCGSEARTLRALARELGIDDSLTWIQHASDDRMSKLYQLAQLLIAPSLHEGFGLVPLEAMASGAAVLASDRGATREVCGRAVYYVDASDVSSIAAGILRVAGDASLRHHLSAAGKAQAARYRWDRCADATAGVYHGLAERARPFRRSMEAR